MKPTVAVAALALLSTLLSPQSVDAWDNGVGRTPVSVP